MLHELLHCKKRLQPKRFHILTPTPVLSKQYRLITFYEYFCPACQNSNKIYDGYVYGYVGICHDGSETDVFAIESKDVEGWLLYKEVGKQLEKAGAHMVQRSNPVFPYQKQNVAVK